MSWQQQTTEPLYPNLIWSRPETKLGAGKLLIIGGQAQEFINVAEAYVAAEKAGAGTVRVVMPESTRKVTKMLPHIEYAPSNASGSFSKAALAELLDAAAWADGILLAGNLGKNSETSLMLERLISGYSGHLTIAYEAIESITIPIDTLLNMPNVTVALTIGTLQKFGIELGLEKPIVSTIGNPEFAAILALITGRYPAQLIIQKGTTLWTGTNTNISSTTGANVSISTVAAHAAVWIMQNPSKRAEALTTAVWQSIKP